MRNRVRNQGGTSIPSKTEASKVDSRPVEALEKVDRVPKRRKVGFLSLDLSNERLQFQNFPNDFINNFRTLQSDIREVNIIERVELLVNFLVANGYDVYGYPDPENSEPEYDKNFEKPHRTNLQRCFARSKEIRVWTLVRFIYSLEIIFSKEVFKNAPFVIDLMDIFLTDLGDDPSKSFRGFTTCSFELIKICIRRLESRRLKNLFEEGVDDVVGFEIFDGIVVQVEARVDRKFKNVIGQLFSNGDMTVVNAGSQVLLKGNKDFAQVLEILSETADGIKKISIKVTLA